MNHMLVHTPNCGPVNLTYLPARNHTPIEFGWCLSGVTDDQKCRATEWMFNEGFIDKLKDRLSPALTPYEACLVYDLIASI
jgi:hypothetical protein